MSLIKQLGKEDVMFVAGETSSIYQHVGLLIVLDSSDRPGFDYQKFRQHCMERVSLIPQFRWKLHSVPLGLDRPYWIEDENFSFDHHLYNVLVFVIISRSWNSRLMRNPFPTQFSII